MDDTNEIISTQIDAAEDERVDPERTVRCRNCDHEITNPKLSIQPHEHTFTNPIGIVFHIACYSDAPGALDLGTPTLVATWFPGYAWSMAICANCHSHLGWWFHGSEIFAGLITSTLIR